mmetsp:Transcript_65829/g.118622  ORF Transcript_65829/g.118622 Transcript_65829/m.118622 type:complete len:290 (-) Transcript_65829:159-1028(-)
MAHCLESCRNLGRGVKPFPDLLEQRIGPGPARPPGKGLASLPKIRREAGTTRGSVRNSRTTNSRFASDATPMPDASAGRELPGSTRNLGPGCFFCSIRPAKPSSSAAVFASNFCSSTAGANGSTSFNGLMPVELTVLGEAVEETAAMESERLTVFRIGIKFAQELCDFNLAARGAMPALGLPALPAADLPDRRRHRLGSFSAVESGSAVLFSGPLPRPLRTSFGAPPGRGELEAAPVLPKKPPLSNSRSPLDKLSSRIKTSDLDDGPVEIRVAGTANGLRRSSSASSSS